MGLDDAERYVSKFRAYRRLKIDAKSILFGDEVLGDAESVERLVPIVGYVGANSEASYFENGQGNLDEVPAPDGATHQTVGVVVKGTSMGALFENWIVFYDEVREPPTPDLLNQLCVIGLRDERVVVKKLIRGQIKNTYTLISNTEPPMYDQKVRWAARVKQMTPR